MPSRAEMRIRVEQALRAIVIVALALMFLRSLIRSNASDASSTRVLNTRALGGGDLARWSVLAAAPKSIHLQIDNVPTPVERAWLGALAGSGSAVTWTGDLMPLMVDAQPIVAPTGGTKVLVASRRGSPIVVGDGGGVVLEPSAAAIDAFSTLRAGAVARQLASGDALQSAAPLNLAGLPVNAITSLRDDAIPLEKRGAAVTSAARRFGAGRVLQLGYDDSWRWRMAGGDTGLRDHRQWWTRQVSSVAYASHIPRDNAEGREKTASLVAPTANRLGGLAGNPSAPDDPAPLSDLVANIGPATSIGLMTSS